MKGTPYAKRMNRTKARWVGWPGPGAACPCGSGWKGRACCRRESGKFICSPVAMSVSLLAGRDLNGHSNPACYLQTTDDCCGTTSREHLMTRAVLELIDGPSTGYRWLKGETRNLPSNSLAARVLCKSHNERLAPLDDVGLRVFAAMRACALGQPGPSHVLANGHDFERWILQRACAVLYSGNADWHGFKIDVGNVAPREVRDALLEGWWPKGGGLHLGVEATNAKLDGIEMAPIFGLETPSLIVPKTAIGFRVSLAGVPFAVRWIGDELMGPAVKSRFRARRPEGITLLGPQQRLDVRFTWDPGVRPGPIAEFGPLTQDQLDALWASVGGRPA